MKKTVLWLLEGVLALSLLGFISAMGQKMPGANAAEFWTYITKTHPYTKWKLWPGHEAMRPGQSPHGAFLLVYVNKPALEAIEKKMTKMPDGAIIVKENYADDKKTLVAITPMSKVKGYNPEAGDWFWTEYDPNGKELASGKVEACIGCHQQQKDKDFIFTWAK